MASQRAFKDLPHYNFWQLTGQAIRKLISLGKVAFNKNPKLLSLLVVLPVLAWLLPLAPKQKEEPFSSEKINLALRRTADGLLRASGDSTSRIPAIEHAAVGVWRVRLEQAFHYEQLPALLQSSLDLHGIRRPYEVAVRRCDDATIDLGYHQLDHLQNETVACGGREMPLGCHYIEVIFLENDTKSSFWNLKTALSLIVLSGLAVLWFFRRPKTTADSSASTTETEWLGFGESRLDVAGQVLVCKGAQQNLTFRETKLLRLFVSNPNRLLERDLILQQVWADEGILVGRSVDMFVSRLRKKLAADTSVGIVAVHGVGYRLDIEREA
ncbi:MAG: winged helix-turn-helix domain-containing protein [Saprospiraceae bacterium]